MTYKRLTGKFGTLSQNDPPITDIYAIITLMGDGIVDPSTGLRVPCGWRHTTPLSVDGVWLSEPLRCNDEFVPFGSYYEVREYTNGHIRDATASSGILCSRWKVMIRCTNVDDDVVDQSPLDIHLIGTRLPPC